MENNQSKPKKEKEVFQAEFQVIETKLATARPDSKGVVLFAPENKEKIIQAFVNSASLNYSFTPSQSKKMVKESSKLKIKDKEDKDGFKKVYDKYREFVKARTSTDKERKILVEPFLEIKSRIDDVAKNDILGILANEEIRLKSEIDQWKEWEQEEANRIEEEAKKLIDDRVKELEEVGMKFDGSFYSIGENISVDIVTIKDFSDEVFSEFKYRVSVENEKLQKAEAVEKLHSERKESLLEFWSFVPEDLRTQNFGEMTEKNFSEILENAKIADKDFKEEKQRQADEAKKQADERKSLNYEKRSFSLEKEGFKIEDNGDVSFVTEAGAVRFTKDYLETSTVEDYDAEFAKKVETKNVFAKKAEDLASQRKKDAENKVKEEAEASAKQAEEDKFNGRLDALLKLGLKSDGDKLYIFEDIKFDVLVDVKMKSDAEWNEALVGAIKRKAELNKEIADKEEAERLQKLPEIEKAERYIAEVMKIEIPQINGSEIAEILADFKNKIKIASDEAVTNLKKLA